MNWDALGAIAELLGALGVIATLVYLSFQIRQNTSAMRGQSDMEYTREFIAWTTRQTGNEELQKIWFKAVNKQPMTRAENLTFLFMLTEWVHLADGCFRRYQHGLMTEETFEKTIADGLLSYFDIEIFAAWWDSERALLTPGFREYINRHRKNNTSFQIQNDLFESELDRLSTDV